MGLRRRPQRRPNQPADCHGPAVQQPTAGRRSNQPVDHPGPSGRQPTADCEVVLVSDVPDVDLGVALIRPDNVTEWTAV